MQIEVKRLDVRIDGVHLLRRRRCPGRGLRLRSRTSGHQQTTAKKGDRSALHNSSNKCGL